MSEPLPRQNILDMIMTASGGKLTPDQAARTWDNTIHPLGRKLGLLTGYVRTQDGTSKRTAAGKIQHQTHWHNTVTEVFEIVRARAMEVLQDDELVQKIMPYLIWNADEECVQTYGYNTAVVGSATKSKHDNQHQHNQTATQ